MINTVIAIYRAIEALMQYLRERLQIVWCSMAGSASARGAVVTAAGFVEDTLAYWRRYALAT